MPAIDRYVIRQMATPCAAVIAALGLVMLLERAQRILQEMAVYGMQARYFLPLLAWQVPYYLAQAIPAAFAATLVIVVARMASDHEWEAMASAGISPRRMARPMTALALLLALATLAVGGWLEPIGRHGYRTLHAVALSESRIRALQPRAVYAPTPEVMLSADASGRDGLRGVFLRLDEGGGKETVITARRARVSTNDATAALEFEFFGGMMLTEKNREVRFASLQVKQPLVTADPDRPRGRDARELTFSELLVLDPARLDDRFRNERVAEIYGRLARSLGIVVLPWLVLPLLLASRANRRWPAVGLIIALSLTLYHGANFCRNLAVNGRLDIVWASVLSIALPVAVCLVIWRLSGGQQAHSRLQWLADLPLFNPRPAQPGGGFRRPPRMGLAAYLSLNIAVMTAAVMLVLVALFQIIDLLEHGEPLVRENKGWQAFAFYAWSQLPARMLQAAPVAMLGGSLMALARMRSGNELSAIQGFGVSVMGVLRRGLLVPLLLGAGMVCVSEFWAPRSDMAFLPWWHTVSPPDPEDAPGDRRWFRLQRDLVQASTGDAGGTVLLQPSIYRRGPDRALVQRINARRAVWAGGLWTLEQASVWRAGQPAPTAPVGRLAWPTSVTPRDVRSFFAAPIPLSGRAAWEALREDAPGDKARAFYQTRIAMIVSTLLAPVVMFVLVTALIVGPRREKRMAILLFQALVGGLSFLVVNGYALVMGQTGQLDPWAAVLVAPLVFASLGLMRALRHDRED